VKEAFEEVNQEFAAMMNTLLEDSSAKLVPVKDVNHLEEGLNVSSTMSLINPFIKVSNLFPDDVSDCFE